MCYFASAHGKLLRYRNCLLFIVALTGYDLLAQDNHAPSSPGDIVISDVTAHSARVAWGAANDPDGDVLVYQVWLRKRVNGVAQAWSGPHETHGTNLVWDGLSAATLYEVKVAAWDGKTFGVARVRENAFTTLSESEGNHPPTVPHGMEFGEISAHRVKIWWGLSTDADGDAITYQVSLRKRTEGEVFDWLPAKTSAAPPLVWEGLEGETVYDARVRASDGKTVSYWLVRERAFRTTAEASAPTKPGEISVASVTAYSARISWGPATGPAGVTLVYEVQVRSRLEGVAQDWLAAGETAALFWTTTNLHPATVYDVRIRAWAQGVAGAWAIREQAFRTLAVEQVNHAPSKPGPLHISDLTPYSVRLTWGASTDPDGDQLVYALNLRKRIEGVAQPWSATREVKQPVAVWDGLTPNTVYEVRIRAWDGRAYSDWFLQEQAFMTPGISEHRLSFLQAGDPAAPDAQRNLLVTWPEGANAASIETAGSLGGWTPCLEVETDGTNSRTLVPISGEAGFFRIRR